jgi:hypothetical protein
MSTRQYLNPYVVGINQGFGALEPTVMAISAGHQRLYLGYQSGAIHYIDLTVSNPLEAAFSNTSQAVWGLASVGNYVMAQDYSGAWATHYVFDSGGTITDQKEWNYYSRDYAWDPVKSRVYFFRDDTSPDDLHYEVVDQGTGKITSAGETPYHGDYLYNPPIRVSPDGGTVLAGPGDFYASDGLLHTGSLGKNLADARYTSNMLVTLDTTDLVEIRKAGSGAVVASYQYLGQPLHLGFGQSEGILVHVMNGTTAFVRLPFYDQDGDTLPRWWETLYGLSDTNAADASGDLDADGLDNAAEYAHQSDPTLADTDGDGLTDNQEVVTWSTDPARADTDGDGLRDGEEVLTHHTNPRNADSDGDGFTDLEEVLYGGDPNDVSTLPVPLTSYSQTFEGSPNLAAWTMPVGASAPWALSGATVHAGTASLKSGAITDHQYSTVRFHGYFSNGQLKFWARVDAENCCDVLAVKVDGAWITGINTNAQWTQYSVPITFGMHDIEWIYQKDYYNSGGADAAWIDDVTFGP